jgi:hypothetical protein
MNRKLLNEARKAMSRNKFLRKIVGSEKSKPFRSNVKLSSKKSQLDCIPSDKENINRLKSLSK